MKKIYAELARIQHDLKAPKNLYNSFGKYSYRNAEGILESVKPLLNGLALIINDEPVLVGDRFYIKATVTLTDGEDSVQAVAYAREDETKKGMDGCQITGACSSYARKYALNALLMIDDAKDSDDDSMSPKNPKNQEKKEVDLPKPAGKPFTPPANTSGAVATAAAIPGVGDYIKTELTAISSRTGIDFDVLKESFAEWRKREIKAGTIPSTTFEKMKPSEAEGLIAVYRAYVGDVA